MIHWSYPGFPPRVYAKVVDVVADCTSAATGKFSGRSRLLSTMYVSIPQHSVCVAGDAHTRHRIILCRFILVESSNASAKHTNKKKYNW